MADASDLKSDENLSHTGSIPVPRIVVLDPSNVTDKEIARAIWHLSVALFYGLQVRILKAYLKLIKG